MPDTGEQPTPARLIPGVYNYCDSWCERCQFQRRCLVHREVMRHETALVRGEITSIGVELEIEEDAEDGPAVSDAERQELLSFLDESAREPTVEELAAITARIEEAHRRRRSHPLSIVAREYAEIARSVTHVLRPLLQDRGDDIALAAVETIERFSLLIAVKTSRAIGGLIADDDLVGEADLDPVQSDANGCAKLLLLLIAESREAWQLLTVVGHASADGIPAAMVRRLAALDAELVRAFPRAMEFVRPGFDEA